MDFGLSKRRALVGGASKGLGFAVAHALADEGCQVILCSRSQSELESARKLILAGGSPGDVAIRPCDLSDIGQVEQLANELKSQGGVDILVNNVGGPAPSSAEATQLTAWRQGFDQIFLGAAHLTQQLVPQMKGRQFGRIITITSLSVVEPIEFLAVSSAMRAAVTGFMKTLASEVAAHGVTVNTVMPGIIHTQRIENLRRAKAEREQSTLDAEMEKTRASIPMRRLGKPEELASLVAFLASERAAYITGANIPVDGGLKRSWV
jgi:3-oxoacyl-[acyl-carrier protein] reductase